MATELTGRIALSAKSEMFATWIALRDDAEFGPQFLQNKVDLVVMRIFTTPISGPVETSLDARVVDYLGKLVALELINPGVDYWGKQYTSVGATGRNETKSYQDRAKSLQDLREYLLSQTRLIRPDIEALLPVIVTGRVASIPRVKEIEVAHTPDPYDFEAPFAPPRDTSL